jgi:hypothetical protein
MGERGAHGFIPTILVYLVDFRFFPYMRQVEALCKYSN